MIGSGNTIPEETIARVLKLRREGFSWQNIADVLHISVSTARRIVARAESLTKDKNDA